MIKEGDRAPAFTLSDEAGEKVSLKDLKGKTVVLYFYPKDLTSGCTQQACDFRDAMAKFRKAGAVVVGVSKDTETTHQKFKDKYKLPFSLLADVETEVAQAYGVWKEKSLYGRKYMGIERTTFVIGPEGKVKRIFPKVKVKGHAEAVLGACKD